jgi:uncharacterized protein (DUF2235 family)
MAKNIVLLSDGTGNSSSKLFKTNVWRLFQALDLRDAGDQVAFYDDGVGTSSFKWWAAFTGVFGIGLKRNVLDIYCFCCRNFDEGDRIFGFGFSRGSFTIRVVAGFIASIGLAPYENHDEAALRAKALVAYREYRRRGTSKTAAARIYLDYLRTFRDFLSRKVMGKPRFEHIKFNDVGKIHFLGLWDTVGAYGGPIDEITRAIDYWYWPLSFPDRFMNAKITRACHALSLEDERDAFKPVLWDERYVSVRDDSDDGHLIPVNQDWSPPAAAETAIDRERISQVWFVGVHADVGGGYPQDGLAHFTLGWMIERARVYGLFLFPEQRELLKSREDRFDKLNDSRHGMAAYYRYKPRKLVDIYSLPPYTLSITQDWRHIKRLWREQPDPEQEVQDQLAEGLSLAKRPDPKIHDAAFERIDVGNDGYAPIVIPTRYNVTDAAGTIGRNPRETEEQADRRDFSQEAVWNIVWKRRVVYFATMFGLLYLVCLPILQSLRPGWGAGSPFAFLVPIVDAAAHYLPAFLSPWFDAFRQAPERLFAGAVYVGVLSAYGSGLQGEIRDRMRAIWKMPTARANAYPDGGIYRLRTSGRYKASYYVLTHWLLPSVFAAVIAVMLLAGLYCAIAGIGRVIFAAVDATGHVCVASDKPTEVPAQGGNASLDITSLCKGTGLRVTKGKTYEVVLTVGDPWQDGYDRDEKDPVKAKGIETDPNGFGWVRMTWPMWFGLPYRRLISVNWLATIIRVGNRGFDEMVLDFKPVDNCHCGPNPPLKATFKAPKNGEVFVYVNDSVLPFFGRDRFYRNNKGTAEFKIAPVP